MTVEEPESLFPEGSPLYNRTMVGSFQKLIAEDQCDPIKNDTTQIHVPPVPAVAPMAPSAPQIHIPMTLLASLMPCDEFGHYPCAEIEVQPTEEDRTLTTTPIKLWWDHAQNRWLEGELRLGYEYETFCCCEAEDGEPDKIKMTPTFMWDMTKFQPRTYTKWRPYARAGSSGCGCFIPYQLFLTYQNDIVQGDSGQSEPLADENGNPITIIQEKLQQDSSGQLMCPVEEWETTIPAGVVTEQKEISGTVYVIFYQENVRLRFLCGRLYEWELLDRIQIAAIPLPDGGISYPYKVRVWFPVWEEETGGTDCECFKYYRMHLEWKWVEIANEQAWEALRVEIENGLRLQQEVIPEGRCPVDLEETGQLVTELTGEQGAAEDSAECDLVLSSDEPILLNTNKSKYDVICGRLYEPEEPEIQPFAAGGDEALPSVKISLGDLDYQKLYNGVPSGWKLQSISESGEGSCDCLRTEYLYVSWNVDGGSEDVTCEVDGSIPVISITQEDFPECPLNASGKFLNPEDGKIYEFGTTCGRLTKLEEASGSSGSGEEISVVTGLSLSGDTLNVSSSKLTFQNGLLKTINGNPDKPLDLSITVNGESTVVTGITFDESNCSLMIETSKLTLGKNGRVISLVPVQEPAATEVPVSFTVDTAAIKVVTSASFNMDTCELTMNQSNLTLEAEGCKLSLKAEEVPEE